MDFCIKCRGHHNLRHSCPAGGNDCHCSDTSCPCQLFPERRRIKYLQSGSDRHECNKDHALGYLMPREKPSEDTEMFTVHRVSDRVPSRGLASDTPLFVEKIRKPTTIQDQGVKVENHTHKLFERRLGQNAMSSDIRLKEQQALQQTKFDQIRKNVVATKKTAQQQLPDGGRKEHHQSVASQVVGIVSSKSLQESPEQHSSSKQLMKLNRLFSHPKLEPHEEQSHHHTPRILGTMQIELERSAANEATIRWDPVLDADSYRVTIKSDTADPGIHEIRVRKCSQKLSEWLKLGHKYQVTVRAQKVIVKVQEDPSLQNVFVRRTIRQGTIEFSTELVKMQIEVERPAAKEATIRWDPVPYADSYKVTIKSDTADPGIHEIRVQKCCQKLSEWLKLGHKYKVIAKAQEDPSPQNAFVHRTIGQGTIEFSTELVKMQIEVERPAAKEATIRWEPVTDADSYKVTIKSDTAVLGVHEFQVTKCHQNLSKWLKLGHNYQVTVIAQEDPSLNNYFTHKIIQQDTIEFRTEFTSMELKELHDKAVTFMTAGSYHIKHDMIKWFYRDKSHAYMHDVMSNKGGIMEVYIKDNNGDPASIINGQIKGLFFATFIRTNTGQPSSNSVFGPSRLYLPAKEVLGHDHVRLYFADFYCINRRHHATVVLTHRGSETDQFCSEKLIELDRHSNDFLYIERYTNQVMVACRELFVEVLYTENIDIPEWVRSHQARREIVPIMGRGSSTPGGLPKNSSCTKCNLDSVIWGRGLLARQTTLQSEEVLRALMLARFAHLF